MLIGSRGQRCRALLGSVGSGTAPLLLGSRTCNGRGEVPFRGECVPEEWRSSYGLGPRTSATYGLGFGAQVPLTDYPVTDFVELPK